MGTLLQAVISGIGLGGISALTAQGYYLTYITTNTLNFGQGDFLMLGAMIGLALLGVGAPWWLALAAVVAYLLPWLYPTLFFVHLLERFAFLYIVIAGLNLLVGYSGQLSLGHAGFYALGAYTAALLGTRLGVPLWAALLAGPVAAAAAGALVALLSLRARGPYLAMVTIAFRAVIEIGANRWSSLTGGPAGLRVPRPEWFAGATYHYAAALLAILGTLALANLVSTRLGRTLRALGESEVAASVLGI